MGLSRIKLQENTQLRGIRTYSNPIYMDLSGTSRCRLLPTAWQDTQLFAPNHLFVHPTEESTVLDQGLHAIISLLAMMWHVGWPATAIHLTESETAPPDCSRTVIRPQGTSGQLSP